MEYVEVVSARSGSVLCSVSQRMDRYSAQNKVDNDLRVSGYHSEVRVHGENCPKANHVGTGHLHSATDDKPYDVDGRGRKGKL